MQIVLLIKTLKIIVHTSIEDHEIKLKICTNDHSGDNTKKYSNYGFIKSPIFA